VIVEPITPATAHYVAARMREADRAEVFATWPDDDFGALAARAAQRGPLAFCAGQDWPIACFGAAQCWPGVYQAWMYATDDFPRVAIPLTRWVKCRIMPLLRTTGAHRMHAYSLDGHTTAQKWMLALGARHEATHLNFGKRGETFHVFVWGIA
jgi:hypothetical protein